jgi:hypothetical protein
MSLSRLFAASIFLLLAASWAGCSSSEAPAAAGDAGGGACASDADCPTSFACAYAASEGCLARGVCQPVHLSTACAAVAVCACDGTITTNCDLPSGFAHKPVAHPGNC